MAFWATLHIIGLVEDRRVVERELERVRVVAQAETGRGEVPAAIARAGVRRANVFIESAHTAAAARAEALAADERLRRVLPARACEEQPIRRQAAPFADIAVPDEIAAVAACRHLVEIVLAPREIRLQAGAPAELVAAHLTAALPRERRVDMVKAIIDERHGESRDLQLRITVAAMIVEAELDAASGGCVIFQCVFVRKADARALAGARDVERIAFREVVELHFGVARRDRHGVARLRHRPTIGRRALQHTVGMIWGRDECRAERVRPPLP